MLTVVQQSQDSNHPNGLRGKFFYSHNYLKGHTFFLLYITYNAVIHTVIRSGSQTKATWWTPLEKPVTATIKREMRVHGTVEYL